jgi:hypothetical protein
MQTSFREWVDGSDTTGWGSIEKRADGEEFNEKSEKKTNREMEWYSRRYQESLRTLS